MTDNQRLNCANVSKSKQDQKYSTYRKDNTAEKPSVAAFCLVRALYQKPASKSEFELFDRELEKASCSLYIEATFLIVSRLFQILRDTATCLNI